ncbi:hypothetical protein ABZS66_19360 [Dactylosporangium sp. NPDC005572]|uniref:hypothetical protein n=1 Tax=Dactylosporangium sp. NPDC005572 TaxID=3156889 RepID=UPI0033A7E17E
MATMDPGTAAAEQEHVVDALHAAGRLVAGLDMAAAALARKEREEYSALRTQVEHAITRAQAVLTFLRQ